MMRDFYDKQVEEKKQRELYEKNLDKIQAQIWKQDTDTFFAKEKGIKKTIRDFEKNNVKELDKQVKMGKYDVDKMNQFEKDYNYDLLQKANEIKRSFEAEGWKEVPECERENAISGNCWTDPGSARRVRDRRRRCPAPSRGCAGSRRRTSLRFRRTRPA